MCDPSRMPRLLSRSTSSLRSWLWAHIVVMCSVVFLLTAFCLSLVFDHVTVTQSSPHDCALSVHISGKALFYFSLRAELGHLEEYM